MMLYESGNFRIDVRTKLHEAQLVRPTTTAFEAADGDEKAYTRDSVVSLDTASKLIV